MSCVNVNLWITGVTTEDLYRIVQRNQGTIILNFAYKKIGENAKSPRSGSVIWRLGRNGQLSMMMGIANNI